MLEELAEGHRLLGGRLDFSVIGPAHDLSADEAHAFRRAFQEALTNARRHAPAEPVRATLTWSAEAAELEVSNTLAPAGTVEGIGPGGGHGLSGMRERFAALANGRAEAGKRDGFFVVTVRVGRP